MDSSRGRRWLKGMAMTEGDGDDSRGWRWPRKMEVAQEDGGGTRGWRWFKGMEEEEEVGGREVFIEERRGCQGFRDLADRK